MPLEKADRLGRRVVAWVVVGMAAGAIAVAFRWALQGAYQLLLGEKSVLDGVSGLPWWECVALPAAGCAVAAGMVAWARRGNQGVGGVMEAVALGRGRISFRASVARVAATFAAVATGASLGREGPIIQVGAGTGDAIGRRLHLDEDDIRVLIAAGTAAGFAAAYGTPLAALLFVSEIVTGATSLRLLMPAALATVAATALSRALIGAAPLYGAHAYGVSAPGELALFAVLGIAAGVVGAGFMKLLDLVQRGLHRIPGSSLLRGGIGGAVAGLVAIGLPAVAGNGYEAIHQILDVGGAAHILLLLALGKAVATAFAVGGGSPGGVFTPGLFLGAVLGRLLGVAFAGAGAIAAPGAYALVGMAALCAATTHAPLMAAVLVFELSGDYGLALPLLAAAMIATAVSRRLHRDSLYTDELRRRRVSWYEAPARVGALPGAVADAAAALPPGYVIALVAAPRWILGRPITDVQSHPGLPAVIAIRRGGTRWVEAQEHMIVLQGDELLAAGTPDAVGLLGRGPTGPTAP
ncbi:MAG TPA: chloride channel protein [Kofleriaceae bacterium]|nr:chloride channel protein [Kofleriaceae bacterium]